MSEIEKRVRTQASKSVIELNPGFFKNTHERIKRSLERKLPPEHVLGANDVRYPLSDPKRPINEPGAIAGHFVRPSTDERNLNKTEQAYLDFLRNQENRWIGVQCITLKLGDDCRYNPDFLVINPAGFLELHEVKGFMREDALVKLKVCARMYRFFKVFFVRKDGQGWKIEQVKP